MSEQADGVAAVVLAPPAALGAALLRPFVWAPALFYHSSRIWTEGWPATA